MLLEDVLKLPIFKSATLVTSEDIGLDNRVESVMVLEGIDVDYWERENELILTSFFALIDLNEDELETFFLKLANVPIAGLVVKIERLIDKIPDVIINLCIKYKIPLLRIPESLRYKDIMIAIYEPLLNKQNHVLKSYYDASRIYNRLPIAQSTFKDIMDHLNKLVNKCVHLSIPGKNVDIFIGETKISDRFTIIKEEILDSQFTQNIYTVTTFFDEINKQHIYSINSTVQNHVVSDFSIKLYYQSLDEFDYVADLMVVENTVHLIRQKLQINHLLKQEKFMLKNNLASSILQSTTRPSYEYQVLLEEANISSNTHYKLIGFMKSQNNNNTDRTYTLSHFRSLNIPYIYYEHSNYYIIIFNIKNNEETLSKDFLNTYLPNNDHKDIVLTNEGTKENINSLFIECLNLLNFKNKFKVLGILTLEDLGMFRYFMDLEFNELKELIPHNLMELYKEDKDLFLTLAELFNNKMNYTKTAEVLYLHPKTIRYRMEKIENLLEIDLKDSNQFTKYFMGVSILKLNER